MGSSQGRKIPTPNSLEGVGREFDCFLSAVVSSLSKEGVGETVVLRKSFGLTFSKWSEEEAEAFSQGAVLTESQTFGFEFSSHLESIPQTSKSETSRLLFIYFPFLLGFFVSW